MFLRGAFACALVAVAASAPAAPRPALSALSPVDPGLWQVRAEGEPVQSICVADPAALMQVRHRRSACTRLVIDSGKERATVHYSCPGAGWGRTTLRVSSSSAVRIDTQGIADNAPFAFVAEARRTGACAPQRAGSTRRATGRLAAAG